MKGVYLEIDASDLQEEIERLKRVCTREKFEQVMYGIFRRTGGHVRRILREDLPEDYNVRPGEVSSAVGGAKVSTGIGGVGCSIPVMGERKHIGGGGKGFPAKGGRRGWNSLKSGHYDINVHVYKGSWSTLPAHLSNYGGQPPFRNLGSSLHGLTFTRMSKARLPIEPVEGIAVPQMPMNRSEPSVQYDIKKYMEERMEQRFQQLIRSGR